MSVVYMLWRYQPDEPEFWHPKFEGAWDTLDGAKRFLGRDDWMDNDEGGSVSVGSRASQRAWITRVEVRTEDGS